LKPFLEMATTTIEAEESPLTPTQFIGLGCLQFQGWFGGTPLISPFSC
jgi:hypothetical protein